MMLYFCSSMEGVEQPTFASRFRQVRESVPGLTKYKLSQLSGVNESLIGKIESGKTVPEEGTVIKLCEHLPVRLPVILSWLAAERLLRAVYDAGPLENNKEHLLSETNGLLRHVVTELSDGYKVIIQADRAIESLEDAGRINDAASLRNSRDKLEEYLKNRREVIAGFEAFKLELSNIAASQSEAEPPEGADLRDKSRPIQSARNAWAVPDGLELTPKEKALMRKLEPWNLLELGPAYVESFWRDTAFERVQIMNQWIADNEATGRSPGKKKKA